MKANKMHYFSNIFDKVLYVFRTCPLSRWNILTTLADVSITRMTNSCCMYSVEILLMMDSGHVRNM